VELGCCLEDKNLIFYVNDTGPGIPSDKTERIFDRFVQLDFSPTRQHEGSGLGLAIVKGYTDILGGNIRVESAVGRGTRFTFSLPYIVAETDKPAVPQPESEERPLKKGLKILIAEDDYASYLYLHKALSDSVVNIVRTLSGEDTVKCVKDDPSIVLVLMDIKLTGMTGLDAARRIREFNKTIPIIAQTAYSLYGDREMALKAGCTDYISKPVDRQELKNLLRKYTNQVS
jgi:CheY-like chemotaxis protein